MVTIDGYQVDPVAGVVFGRRGRPLTSVSGGYLVVSNGYRGFREQAHRLIWRAIHGPIDDGLQINHRNGIKTDNRIDNLELVTPSENTKHAYRLGLLSAKGERNGRSIGKRRATELARGGLVQLRVYGDVHPVVNVEAVGA